MPQTREHLAICSLLHIRAGLVALTKADLVEPDWLELVRDDVAGLVRGTLPRRRAGRRRVREDRRRPRRAARRRFASSPPTIPARSADQLPRLPIDRVFTIKGFGTVVTGTLAAGRFAVDDRVEVFPRGAAGEGARPADPRPHGDGRARGTAHRDEPAGPRARGDRARRRRRARGRARRRVARWTARSSCSPTRRGRSRRATASASTSGTSEVMARVLFLDRTELEPGRARVRARSARGARGRRCPATASSSARTRRS